MRAFNNLLGSKGDSVKWAFFPKDKFVSGRWYRGRTQEFDGTDPIVIQNNWAVGIDEKIGRAKRFKQWYLEEDDRTCVKNFKEKPFRGFVDCKEYDCEGQ